MKIKIFPHLIFASVIIFPTTSFAVTPANEQSLEDLLDLPFIAIATGIATPIEKSPSTASVITAEDIKAMGALTLDEVLERVPGLHVEPSTLNRLDPVYTFRGIYTGFNPQVLFLLNGHRISSSLFNGALPSNMRITVENISRIEVVRGPGSAIYGADAFAGVINIITKSKNEINGMEFGVRGGSFNMSNAWVQLGTDISKNWDMTLNLEYAKQDADESRIVNSDTQSLFDLPPPNGFGTNASLAPSYLDRRYNSLTFNMLLSNEKWKVGLDSWIQRDNGVGAGAAQTIDHEGRDDTEHFLFTAEYNNKDLVNNWDFTSAFSYQIVDIQASFNIFPPGLVTLIGSSGNIDFTTPGVPVVFSDGFIGNPVGRNTIPQLDLIGIYSGLDNHILRLNVGAKEEKLDSRETKNFGPGVISNPTAFMVIDGTLTDVSDTPFVFTPDASRNVKYISVQDVWELSVDWTLTAGVRYDNYSDFGGTTNPRAALVWTTTPKLITKLLYGSAFRAPSFSEQLAQNNPIILGNPDLKPETIDTVELSFSYAFTNTLKSNLSFYDFETQNMIEYVGDAIAKTAQNVKNLDGQGFEIEVNWLPVKSASIMFNFSHQETENSSTNEQDPFVAQNQAYLDGRWKFSPNWKISSQIQWIADRERELIDTRQKIDDYILVNLSIRRTNLMKQWEVALSIKNLLDDDTREPSSLSNGLAVIPDDYPLNERAIYLEARYEFKN